MLYVDENSSPGIAAALESIFLHHKFVTAQRAHLLGDDDIDLFPDLAARGVGALLTIDKNQLKDETERAGLRSAGLHWVGVPQVEERVRGTALLSRQIAMLAPAVHDLLQQWPTRPTAFHLAQPPASAIESSEVL